MNHCLVAQVDFSAADDFGDIAGVVGLKQSNLDAFILEVALCLREVQGSMVWRSVPVRVSMLRANRSK